MKSVFSAGQRCLACVVLLSSMPWLNASDLRLWYTVPGTNNMTQGLLIGNGRLGAAVPGGIANDIIILNEDSLWAGTSDLSGGYSTGPTGAFGAYQMFGNLVLNLPSHTNAAGYLRALDIGTGIATVDYTNNGIGFHRELFCSAPDQVLVMQLSADAPASYTGSVQLADSHSVTTSNTADGLMFSGALVNGEQYEAQLVVANNGGSLNFSGGAVNFTNCNSLTLLVALGTSYVPNYSLNYQGNNPHSNVLAQVTTAAAKSFSALETAHTNDFAELFNRVTIWLGDAPSSRTNLPTDQRISANSASDDDPWMEQLMFQYGRYLMISSSRGALPMNLQGLWNDNNNPNWASDYHSDINIEMMYWETEVANLPECFVPFVNWLQTQIPAWRYVTTNTSTSINNGGYGYGFGGTNGWTTRTSHNINGGEGWNWIQSGNAWYCMHLWEHYAFSGDTNYLLTVYPIFKETCQFWQQHLQSIGPNTNGLTIGTLIATNGWSPEHGPWENGVSFDQELIWDVFNNYRQACAVLNTDVVYSATVSNLQANLLVPGVGPWGELREWLYNSDSQTDNHRHTSHLVGLYPGRQFTPDQTPALVAAAKVGLLARGDTGDSANEWADVNRTALFARLLDPVNAHHKLALYCGMLEPNLVAAYSGSIAQWDGSCGVTAAIAEMLLQSHEGRIALLPALPTNWPAGSVSGLRARGGFTVDMFWTNGWLTSATIYSTSGTNCTIQYGNETIQTNIPLGGSVRFIPQIPPNTPTGVFAKPGNQQAIVGWSAAPGASSYNVKQSLTTGSGYVTVTNVSGTSFLDAGLANGSTYYFVVSAINAYGESANSAEVSAMPDAGYATNLFWSGAFGGTWDTTAANWFSNGVSSVYSDGAGVIFDDTALSNNTVTLSATRTPASVLVNNSVIAYTISGGAIAGAGSLTKSGSSSLTLDSANSYTNGTTLSAGQLTIGNAGALGTGPLTISGGTLDNSAQVILSNNIVISSSGAIQLGSANNLTLGGIVSGAGTLTLGDDGNDMTIFLAGTNAMSSGIIAIANNANCIRFLSPAAGNAKVDWLFNNTSANKQTLDFASGTISLGSISGNGVIQGNVYGANSQNVTLSVGGDNNSTTFSGIIHNNQWGTGPVGLIKVGNGTLMLTGANDYSGLTAVNGGELVISSTTVGNGNYTVTNAATLGVTNLSNGSALASNLTIAAGASLEFQNVSSSTMPLISTINLTVNSGCTVRITGSSGFVAGNNYPLIHYAGNFSGSLTNLQLQMPYGWRGALVSNANQIALNILAPVSVNPPALNCGISSGQLQIDWPSDHTGWRLLMSANLIGTNWIQVSGATSTNFINIWPTNGTSFFRLVYP